MRENSISSIFSLFNPLLIFYFLTFPLFQPNLEGGHINTCMVEIKLGYDLLFNFPFGYKCWRLCPSKIKRRSLLKLSHKNLATPTYQ